MYENTLIPILYRLKAKSIINASIHMFLTEFFFKKTTEYHRDWEYDANTAVLNLTSCDGGTQLKLKARSIINASVHMFLTEFFLKKSTVYHQDWPYNSTTAILNLTNCDGGTQLKIKNKEIVVESKENRIVIFNTQIKHRTIKNTTAGARYILNMNYF